MEAKANTAPCGTEAAYNRHRRFGETPCRACKDAVNAAARERRLRREASTVDKAQKAGFVPAHDLDTSDELGRLYAILAAQLEEAPPSLSPPIAGRMLDILKIVMGTQNMQGEVPSVADELAKARASRESRPA